MMKREEIILKPEILATKQLFYMFMDKYLLTDSDVSQDIRP